MRWTIALHQYMDIGHDWAKHHAALMAFVAGTTIAIVVVGIALSAVGLVRSSLAHPARIESTLAYPARELPREWRWEGRDAVSFDDAPAVPAHRRRMRFPEDGAAAGGLEWIRDEARR